MDDERPAHEWRPIIAAGASPLYLAIADSLASDIQKGALAAGDRLPPQRALADALDIDFTTVSRAYAEARKRGLIEGRVGQGTYVRAGRASRVPMRPASGLVDMGMNLPPKFDDPSLGAQLWAGIGDLEADGGMDLILRYQDVGGAGIDRQAGVDWLADRLPDVSIDRLLVCPGAQSALLSLVTALGAKAGPIAVEALTYPGFRSLAAHLSIELAPVAIDRDGLDPDDFRTVCRTRKPRILYCTPTLHNPTTATVPLDRRKAIVEIAREYGVSIIEDDAYGKLSGSALPPLAALAPEIVYHVAGLSKCLSPALRVAYVVVPDLRAAVRLSGAVRATTSIASPLGAAIATRWIETGLAGQVVAAIRAETEARRAIADRLLADHGLVTAKHAFHSWLPLSPPWTRGEFAARLRQAGIGVVPSDSFTVIQPVEAVRLGLGAPETRDRLSEGLSTIADLLQQSPAMSSLVV
ncbi:PLP-dependent aminotransferase family protein [Sphingomonas sp. H39-1-10]|uniref:aminotransferase-like domain-containing protein n=1 Tax=Sphingomonadales TaxID=204457 RepID=UPI000C20B410|nr:MULTISPECIES: PLP-dependent aminotransferase family protein [Sphingomonadaceae]MDF0490119.1 PLP-dependent aminotransferase family protein [Sphingomonas pollutisoli]PJG45461.1 GntR family transcriptional regulator [Sphingobium sp. LB126]